MVDKNINQQIIEICDEFVIFFQQLKEEVKTISNEDNIELVCRWHSYFEEHGDVIGKFSYTKYRMK